MLKYVPSSIGQLNTLLYALSPTYQSRSLRATLLIWNDGIFHIEVSSQQNKIFLNIKTKKASLQHKPEQSKLSPKWVYIIEVLSSRWTFLNAHPKPNKLFWKQKALDCVAELLCLQNSSQGPRSMLTGANFMQIFSFATRRHRPAMQSGS